MAWSQWLHKAYAEYDRAEAARKRRVNPDYPDSPGTGVGVPANALRSRIDGRVLRSRVNEQPLIARAA